MGSREDILERLSMKTGEIKVKTEVHSNLHVVPDVPDNPEEMLARFIVESEKLSCKIHQVSDEEEAIKEILALMEGEKTILGWAFDQIGLPGLEEAFGERKVSIYAFANPNARYGITGVETALAATGSIILTSGAGKPRAASLLPPIHIAVLHSEQIIQDLESWVSPQQDFTEASNIFVISGPSKTADIAMELVMGMHGPQELHLILVN